MKKALRPALLASLVTLIAALWVFPQEPAQQPKRSKRGEAQLPEGATTLRDLEYARAGKSALLLDLYLPPESDGASPVIVWIHGGAWRMGSKHPCPAARQVARGYAVASINYRLSNEATFPAQIYDCKAAVRWLRANAAKYRLDPDRIGVWGSSAGGHLVALLGTSGDVKELEGELGNNDKSSRVQAVCDFFGPAQLSGVLPTEEQKKSWGLSVIEQFLGGPIEENQEKAALASPTTHATKDDPPFLIMHGDKDNVVPLNQSELLLESLKKAGVEVELVVIKGAAHGFKTGADIDPKVDGFFDKHLKKPVEETPKEPTEPETY
ncbi:MAG: alpha/beta hydrolase [Planctomycetota bacterium]|nr:alpha/beta hydrolase [Planctomycetota bacterium]